MKQLLKAVGFFILATWLLTMVAQTYGAEPVTKKFRWDYDRFWLNKVQGFRLYVGTSESEVNQLVADIPANSVDVISETPIILAEDFNTDTSSKYETTGGKWTWQSDTKNMLVETGPGETFMLVLPYDAGVNNYFGFQFWPKKSHNDAAALNSYLKPAEDNPYKIAYYELRLGDVAGTKNSNFRKVVDSKFGGVEGAFMLPRYAQCAIKSEGNTICPGFPIAIKFNAGEYGAISNGVSVGGNDATPLDIKRLEIIIYNQDAWIDSIRIGGKMILQKAVPVTFPASRVWFAISAYNADGEGEKSLSSLYDLTSGTSSTKPNTPFALQIID